VYKPFELTLAVIENFYTGLVPWEGPATQYDTRDPRHCGFEYVGNALVEGSSECWTSGRIEGVIDNNCVVRHAPCKAYPAMLK
jgi:hypothetical protein